MSLLKRLLGRREEPKVRTRVCMECGMPVDQHRTWCAVWQTQQEMEQKAPARNGGLENAGHPGRTTA